MVAVAGGPAAGKSTFTAALVEAVNGSSLGPLRAVYVPMDGFHKTTATLQAEGTTALKGKPETFDLDALYEFLQRLKRGDYGFSGPHYSRACHDVVANAYFIGSEDIAIVEGNYLLLGKHGWSRVRDLFDYKIFLKVTEEISAARLWKRHAAGGRSVEWIREHLTEVDLPNHRLVASSEEYADVVICDG